MIWFPDAVFAMVTNIALQAVLIRSGLAGLLASIFEGCAGGAALLLLAMYLQGLDVSWQVPTAVIVYGSASFWYFVAINLRQTSIRVRMIEQIAESNGIRQERLARICDAREIVESRLRRLAEKRIIDVRDETIQFRYSVFFVLCLPILGLKRLFYGNRLRPGAAFQKD